jgi:acetylornithine aminotransferase
VLAIIEKDGLLENAVSVGALLRDGIGAIEHSLLKGVRGRGLWLALVLTGPHSAAVQDAARAAGFLVNAVQPDAVRLAPPLILTGEQAQSLVDALPFILDAAAKEIH